MDSENKTLRMKIARYVTAAFPNLTKALKEGDVIGDNPEEERLAEQFLREAATAVLFVADQDEKRLKADRDSGEYREAVEKMVDGVVEDIKSCRHADKRSAQQSLLAAVTRSDYVADPGLNMKVLEFGTHPSAYFYRFQAKSSLTRLPWKEMAHQCMWYDCHEELSRRPEFVSLPLPAA